MSTLLHRESPSLSVRTGSRLPLWLAVVLVLLAVGSGVLLGRVTKGDQAPPADLASGETTEMIDSQRDAVNSGDVSRIAPYYAENGTLYDIGNKFAAPVEGRGEIARVLAGNIKLFGPGVIGKPGTAVQRGPFVAYVGSWGDVSAGVIVLELDPEGKILNQWAIHPAQ